MYMYIFSLNILVAHIKNVIQFFAIIDLNSEKKMYSEKKKKLTFYAFSAAPMTYFRRGSHLTAPHRKYDLQFFNT